MVKTNQLNAETCDLKMSEFQNNAFSLTLLGVSFLFLELRRPFLRTWLKTFRGNYNVTPIKVGAYGNV